MPTQEATLRFLTPRPDDDDVPPSASAPCVPRPPSPTPKALEAESRWLRSLTNEAERFAMGVRA